MFLDDEVNLLLIISFYIDIINDSLKTLNSKRILHCIVMSLQLITTRAIKILCMLLCATLVILIITLIRDYILKQGIKHNHLIFKISRFQGKHFTASSGVSHLRLMFHMLRRIRCQAGPDYTGTKGLEGGKIHPIYKANSVARPRLTLEHTDPLGNCFVSSIILKLHMEYVFILFRQTGFAFFFKLWMSPISSCCENHRISWCYKLIAVLLFICI